MSRPRATDRRPRVAEDDEAVRADGGQDPAGWDATPAAPARGERGARAAQPIEPAGPAVACAPKDLLKPVGRRRFAQALERARERLGDSASARRLVDELDELRRSLARGSDPEAPPQGPDRVSVRHGSRILLLATEEIIWFEADDTLVFARTASGRFLVDRTLSELEQQLERQFFRAHRSCLVNLGHIAEIRPLDAGAFAIVCPGAGTVPLSRRQARRLREIFRW